MNNLGFYIYKPLALVTFSPSLTVTSKDGLKSLSLDRNLEGVSRWKEGSFLGGCLTGGEAKPCLLCCEMTAWKALLWKRFMSKGVTAFCLWISKCASGCAGESGFGLTPFGMLVSNTCSTHWEWKETNEPQIWAFTYMRQSDILVFC